VPIHAASSAADAYVRWA